MKGLFAKLAIGVAALAFVTAAQAGETLDRVMGKKAMVVATNSGWPPQSYLDDSNELVGFDIDVSKEIAKRLGVEVSFETPDWATLTGGRWQGRYDLGVGSVTPTKARAQVIDFAGIYYFSPYVYVLHKDSQAKSVADLNGKIIGVETATTSEDFIRRQLEIDAPACRRSNIRSSRARSAPSPIPCCPSTICALATGCASMRSSRRSRPRSTR